MYTVRWLFSTEHYREHKHEPRARATLYTSTTQGGSGRAVWMQPGQAEGDRGEAGGCNHNVGEVW